MTENRSFYALGLALAVFSLLLPVDGRPFILSDWAHMVFGVLGPGYDEPKSDMSIYMRAGECWRTGVPVWSKLCNDVVPNLLPAPLLLVVPFTAYPWGQDLLYALLWGALYGGLLTLPFRRHLAGLVTVLSLILLPGFLLGMRSGNMEVFCFCLVALACWLDQRQRLNVLPALLIMFAASYKIYPAIVLAVLRHRLAAFSIALLLILYFGIFHGLVINTFQTTRHIYENSFGLIYHYGYVSNLSPNVIWLAPPLISFYMAEIWLYPLAPHVEWFWCLLLMASVLTLTLPALVAFSCCARRAYYDYNASTGRFVIVGCLLIVPVMGFFWNFSYRYWVVFLIVPQLIDEVFRAGMWNRRRWLHLIVLMSVYIGGVMQYRLYPMPSFIHAANVLLYLSLRDVVQYYAELIVAIYALTVGINWLACDFLPDLRHAIGAKRNSPAKSS